jgi:uncharacterized protein YggE
MKYPAIPSFILLITLTLASAASAQVGGNASFAQSGGRAKAEQSEKAKRTLGQYDLPPSRTSTFVEASVLMNVKADEYVAVFAIARDGKDVAECDRKMDATLKTFLDSLIDLGVKKEAIFVDYIAQTKTYGFELEGDVAKEKLVGFELKKNVSIHYKDKALLDKLTAAAAKAEIFDLVKVDYVVKDLGAVNDRLSEEAARIIKKKIAKYERLLDIQLKPPAQVYTEKTSAYYPAEMYDHYIAAETEEMTAASWRQKYTVQSARKGRSFYFNGLDSSQFDAVIDPIITEPVVQFTFYWKVKYEVEQPKAK